MLIGMLLQLCAAVGDETTHCDVRVRYITEYSNVAECAVPAKEGADKLAEIFVKHEPELTVYSQSGECFEEAGLIVKLNDLPEFMDAIGRTYQITFY